MIKRKYILISVVIWIGAMHLTGCGNDSAKPPVGNVIISDTDSVESSMTEVETEVRTDTGANVSILLEEGEGAVETDTPMLSEESKSEAGEPEQSESESEADDKPKEVPQLPDTGRQLEDFVPEGWEILICH